MSVCMIITEVKGREILDSRGNPTVEVEVEAKCQETGAIARGRACVPSGASTGRFEAVELRDGEPRFFGLGVSKAVSHVNAKIRDALLGKNVLNQKEIDKTLILLDGTDNKESLGANAILGTSMACACCSANALQIPLFLYLGGCNAKRLPRPMMNVINGGVHAKNPLDFQEFMIVPAANTIKRAIQIGAEVYHYLKKILEEDHKATAVGDEGGFAPDIKDAHEVFMYLNRAVEKAGYKPGEDVFYAMDAASSELYDTEKDIYVFEGEKVSRSREEMIGLFEELVHKFPIISIEDPLDQEDWDGWQELTRRLGDKVMLVGDDLFVTNTKRIKCGIDLKVANAVLIKVNQIGSLTEAMDAIELAHKSGYTAVISHRSGETEDTFISDLSVAVNAAYMKTGAPCRGERTAKYNQLLRIEEQL